MRSIRAVSAVATLVVLASVPGGAGVARLGPAGPPAGGPAVSEAPDPATAAQAARLQGSPVEATDLRTETRTVYAEPDGTMTAELTTRPVRVEQDGSWVDVDTTLARRPDGSIGPAAAVADLSFSEGGADRPLVRYGTGDSWIELAWPGELPAPELAGDTATYPEVLPGVDLRLQADVDGFAHYLVLKDRAAAVDQVRLGLRTHRVEVRTTESGGLEARDAGGTVIFAAPVSRMWDSGAPPREADVGVAVDGDALVLRPDQALLTDPATRYPVTVDPKWHTADKQAWATVLSGKPGTSYWNRSADPSNPSLAQLGRCYEDGSCNGIGAARTYWRFDTRFLAGKFVLEGYLDFDVVYSPDCASTRNHQVYKANGAISAGTTWNNMPGGTLIRGFAVPTAGRAGCPGKQDVAAMVTANVNRGGTTTFFVKAANEADQLAWRKYNNNTKLRVRFNTAPNLPTNLTTDPPLRAPCKWCGGVSYLGDAGIRLKAKLTDPDGDAVRSRWNVNTGGTVREAVSPFKPSGNIHDYYVDLTGADKKSVGWAVKAEDGTNTSGWANGKGFVVDRTPPAVPPKVTGVLYQPDRWHGGVGVPGTFVFDSTGKDGTPVPDVDHFVYGWTDPPTTKAYADKLGGTASVVLVPPGDGPQDLLVQSVDRAGHRSGTQVYHFYVRAGSGPLAQWSFEGNADDEAFLGDRDGTLVGDVAYVPGAVGQAISLDGDAHVTAPNAVSTDASFSVSAWVRLGDGEFARAAVSQDGTNFAGFDLWYRPDDGGRWVFGMARSDASYQGTDMAWSAQPAQLGVWTHLTGVYDAEQRQLRLYVNGVESGTADRTVADWPAAGNVRIGRTMWNGSAGVDYWSGQLDEVKLYDRILTKAEIQGVVGADDVQVGHWKFDEPGGTTGRNEVAGGEMATLQNGAAFTGDGEGAVGGAVLFDGSNDVVATAGPVLHTDQSFSVAAWVYLEQPPEVGQTATALSQDGDHISGFFLGYRQVTDEDQRWELYVPSADAPDRPADAVVRSSVPAELNGWTHLAAVYDASAGQLRLYVNGDPTDPGARPRGFDAAGPLAIGRGFHGGASGHWTGKIDEVRAYSRALSDAEVRGVVSRDGVALGEWHLDGNLDDASGNGRQGTLNGSPDWTGGQTEVPDPTDLALRLDGAYDDASLPNTVDVQQSFSVAVWAKLDKVGGTASVVSQDGEQTSAFQLQATPAGRWAFAMYSSDVDGGGTQHQLVGPDAQVGVWTHLVGIYDASAQQLSLYVNGVRAGTLAHNQTWNHSAGQLWIGAAEWRNNHQNHFPGAVDDLAVYGRVLFAEEIRAMAGRDLTLAHNWRLDESSGDTAADAVGRRAATLAGGATRVPGRLGNAVALDGVDGRVATGGVDIRTDASFTVTAWVNLAETCDPGPAFSCTVVAASLDGGGTTGASKFRLGHTADRGQNPEGVWVFELPEPDGRVTKAAVTVLPSDFGRWVHLAGVYDEPTGKLWLYVNGTRKGDGTLNDPWHGTGGLQIGRGLDAGGNPAQYLAGSVDDVRLYSGGLDDGRIGNLYHSYPAQSGEAELPTAGAGYWTFDENTGTAAADSSGSGLTATLSGGASWVPGRTGYAGSFDGAAGYAETAGPVLDTDRSFSVSAWAYVGTTDTTGEPMVVLGQDGAAASAFYLYYDRAGRNWAVALPDADTAEPGLVQLRSSEPALPGHWTQLGLVYNAELGQLRLYVNGRLSGAQVGVATWAADGPLSIGRGSWAAADRFYFHGAIDDVRAFDTALSDGEMGKVYDDIGPVGVGDWRFDDETVRDWSSRSNPTTTTGAASYVDGPVGKALGLDGQAAATTQRWGVPPAGSMTVSAWARLTGEPAVQTVVAQDGTRMSGFVLQYRPNLDRWVFGAWTQDADDAELVYAHSGAPAVLGEWTHLTGVYDHVAGELRLYVDGQLAGSQDGVTLWPSTGGLTIGRGKLNGAPAQFFTGAIDEVRTDLGIVPDDEIAQRAQRP